MDEHNGGSETRSGLAEAGPLIPSIAEAIPDADGPFWVTFFSLIVLTLFVPVFPLYKGTFLVWFVPVWAVYVFGWIVPLIALPIVVLHITICFYVARFTFPYGEHTRSISLLSMMLIVSVVCIFIAMTVRFHDVGFVATFLVFSGSISSANLFVENRLCGVVYPRLGLGLARFIFWLSCAMAVFGLLTIGSPY